MKGMKPLEVGGSAMIIEKGEFELIDWLKGKFDAKPLEMVKGIGDDAAVFSFSSDKATLITTDLLIEGVHFKRDKIAFPHLGWKSLAANLSDIAAMGGEPKYAFISIASPTKNIEELKRFFLSFSDLAQKNNIYLAGGDLSFSLRVFFVSITVIGFADKDALLYRKGAKAGDKIFVTGTLGNARAGLHILEIKKEVTPELFPLVETFIRPIPHIKEGKTIAKTSLATSMIDISDGFAQDLGHILEESQKGCIIFQDKLPVSKELINFCKSERISYLDFALSGGEDYRLIFTVPKEKANDIKKIYLNEIGNSIFEVGEITAEKGFFLIDLNGKKRELTPKGWDHFKR